MFDSWRLGKENNSVQNVVKEEKAVSIGELKNMLSGSDDIVFNEIKINQNEELVFCFVDGLVDTGLINQAVLKPIIDQVTTNKYNTIKDIYTDIDKGIIYHASYKIENDLYKAIDGILSGNVFMIGNKESAGVLYEVKGFEKRGIQEPTDENVLKGSKDSFIEVLRVNTALIRRKVVNKELKIEQMDIGQESKTNIAIVYLNDKVDKDILGDVKAKIEGIKAENIISPADFDERIFGKKFTIFPRALYTERPDKLCANLEDGMIGIIIDGLPTVYIVPAVFNMFLQAPEDYSFGVVISSFVRIIRYICMVLAIFLPAFYISVMTFHQEMIPTDLAMAIMKSKEGVPFPAFLEVLFMIIAFEILIEAGIRFPKVIGQTTSIVGGLIVGQASVEAKIVSPSAVIIIAITSIAGFIIPNQDFFNSIRISRLVIFILATISGLFGLSIGFIILLYHLCSIETFGVPYMIPYSSNEGRSMLKDTFIRNRV